MTAPHKRLPEPEEFRPIGRRRKGLIALLAVATTGTLMWSLLREPGGAELGRQERAELAASAAASGLASGAASHVQAACVDSPNQRCVGGKVDVIALPVTSQGR